MLIDSTKHSLTTQNVGQSTRFGVRMTPQLLRSLSVGLYSDPIKAAIREVYCNALDANPHELPTIKLPTPLDPVFEVSDNGPGLDREALLDLCLNYGATTKNNDDSTIGGFGVGFKSPFAATSSWSIVSRTPTSTDTYFVHMDADGYPACTPMGSIPNTSTSSPTGLTISWEVNPNDIQKYCAAWDELSPTLTKSCEYVWTSPCGFFRLRPYTPNTKHTSTIIMAGVPYPTPCNNISYNHRMLLSQAFDITVPNGYFRPTMSRETIEWDEASLEKFKALLDRFLNLSIHQKTILASIPTEEGPPRWWTLHSLVCCNLSTTDIHTTIKASHVSRRASRYPNNWMRPISITDDTPTTIQPYQLFNNRISIVVADPKTTKRLISRIRQIPSTPNRSTLYIVHPDDVKAWMLPFTYPLPPIPSNTKPDQSRPRWEFPATDANIIPVYTITNRGIPDAPIEADFYERISLESHPNHPNHSKLIHVPASFKSKIPPNAVHVREFVTNLVASFDTTYLAKVRGFAHAKSGQSVLDFMMSLDMIPSEIAALAPKGDEYRVAAFLGIKPDQTTYETLTKLMRDFMKMYPLVSFRDIQNNREHVIEYIEAMKAFRMKA